MTESAREEDEGHSSQGVGMREPLAMRLMDSGNLDQGSAGQTSPEDPGSLHLTL